MKKLILAFGILISIATASAFTIIFSGSNLVTNGTFDTDSDWSKGTGWTISIGTANANISAGAFLVQDMGLTAGKRYRYSFEVKNYSSGSVRVGDATQVWDTTSADGICSGEVTLGASPGPELYLSTASAFVGSIDNVTVQEVKESAKITNYVAGWDFTSGWTATGGSITDSDTFVSTPIHGGVYKTLVTVGKKYRCTIAGDTTASSLYVVNQPGSAPYSGLLSGTFNTTFEFTATQIGIYLRNSDAGTTNITHLEITEITHLPYSKGKIGEWTLAESDQQSDTRSLDNSSAGTSYVSSTEAYGEFDFSIYTTGTNYIKNTFISTTTDAHGSGDGYTFYSSNNNAISLRLKDDTVLFTTADSYTADDTWYSIRITRTGGGEFEMYIKGGVYSDWTLVDTITNNTYTTSAYFVADLDVGDKLRKINLSQ